MVDRVKDNDQELSLALIQINKYLLKDLPHIRKYHKLRNLHQELVQKMIDYYQDHPEQFKKEFKAQTKQGIKLDSMQLDLRNQTDLMFLGDLILYPHQINVDLCTYFLEHKKVRSLEKIKFVEAMRSSKLGLYEVLSANRNQGTCEIRNMLTGEKLTLVDESLCMNTNLSDYCSVWRIIQNEDICFQTGFHLIFKKRQIRKWIKKHKGKEIRIKELLELYQLNKEEVMKTYIG